MGLQTAKNGTVDKLHTKSSALSTKRTRQARQGWFWGHVRKKVLLRGSLQLGRTKIRLGKTENAEAAENNILVKIELNGWMVLIYKCEIILMLQYLVVLTFCDRRLVHHYRCL